MEGIKEENNNNLSSGGATVKGNEAHESFRIVPRVENYIPFSGPTTVTVTAAATTTVDSTATTTVVPVSVPVSGSTSGAGSGTDGKKKRGRPRKYGPDGQVSMALSPMPISASIPLTGEYSAWKRGRGRPGDSVKKTHKLEYETSAEKIAYFVGANFTPHVITVNAGEDVTMKVMSFSQQGARAICILCANGTISNVTLRQPTSSGGTLTYEGRFEILSLSGSFMPTDHGGTKSRSGGMSISLAGPDGRVVGGGLAGLLIAAGPVQVVVGSFLPGHQLEQKHKKHKPEPAPPVVTPITINVHNADNLKSPFTGVNPIIITSPSSQMQVDNSTSSNPVPGFNNSAADNKSSSPGEESKGTSQSNCEVSC